MSACTCTSEAGSAYAPKVRHKELSQSSKFWLLGIVQTNYLDDEIGGVSTSCFGMCLCMYVCALCFCQVHDLNHSSWRCVQAQSSALWQIPVFSLECSRCCFLFLISSSDALSLLFLCLSPCSWRLMG